jgi:hypothetical protein
MDTRPQKPALSATLHGDLLGQQPRDSSHFPCWLDGSYLGEDHYTAQISQFEVDCCGGRRVGASG